MKKIKIYPPLVVAIIGMISVIVGITFIFWGHMDGFFGVTAGVALSGIAMIMIAQRGDM